MDRYSDFCVANKLLPSKSVSMISPVKKILEKTVWNL